jgi:hypothetical protein
MLASVNKAVHGLPNDPSIKKFYALWITNLVRTLLAERVVKCAQQVTRKDYEGEKIPCFGTQQIQRKDKLFNNETNLLS